MTYFWALLGAAAVAGAVYFSRQALLKLPWSRWAWAELAGAAAAGLLLGGLIPLRTGGQPLTGLRLLIAAAALAGAGRCDLETRRIPNLFPALLLGGFGLCCALDLLVQPERFAAGLLGGLLGGGAALAFLWLCRRVTHGGIGGGDVKLLSALACLLGLYGGFGVLLFAQLSAVTAAAVLLLLRRVTLKDSIPFAPFFFAGLLITVWLGNF